ncbi:MAG: TadG family pilus assembly protein, partial [Perlucidibaca sp.]
MDGWTAGGRRAGRERGAAVIMTAGFMLLAAFCMALVIDAGRLYMEKRSLQRVADMAAMEVAARGGCGDDSDQDLLPRELAEQNTRRNGFVPGGGRTLSVTCGDLDVVAGQRVFLSAGALQASGSAPCDDAAPSASARGNAVRVVVCHSVPASLVVGGFFMGRTVPLRAEAVSLRSEPVAVFRVSPKLLSTNPSAPLMMVLKAVGVDLTDTELASANGLAGVKITPAGLLKALGIPVAADISAADFNDVLAAQQISVGEVIDATLDLVTQQGALGLDATLLNTLETRLKLSELNIQLGSDEVSNGLFALVQTASGMGSSALDAGVDALGLVSTAIALGTGENAAAISLGGGLGATVKAQVIEAPSIGVGGVGTRAYSAQTRVFADLGGGLVGGLLSLLGGSIDLDLIVDAVAAYGTITRIECFPEDGERYVDIEVNSSVANVCLGDVADSYRSRKDACTNHLETQNILTLLGSPLLRGKLKLAALEDVTTLTEMHVGETREVAPNSLQIGTLLSNLVDELPNLLTGLDDLEDDARNRKFTASEATTIADAYISKAGLGSKSTLSSSDLNTLRNLLRADGLDWTRPGYLLGLDSGKMLNQWYDQSCFLGCLLGVSKNTARSNLINALQTDAASGLLGLIFAGLGDLVVKPLVSSLVGPLFDMLEPLLNGLGSVLANLLADVLGLDLGRTTVT